MSKSRTTEPLPTDGADRARRVRVTAYRTYPYSQESMRALHGALRDRAAAAGSRHSAPWWTERTIALLQDVAARGLPDCYRKPEEFLYDFWPDMPWDQSAMLRVMTMVEADPRWPAVVDGVRASVGLDMGEEFRRARAVVGGQS